MRKMHFPRMVIPLARVLTATLNLLVSLVAVLVFLLAYGVDPTLTWLLFPARAGGLLPSPPASSMLVSALYVRFRDVAPIWSVVVDGAVLRVARALHDRVGARGLADAVPVQPAGRLLEQARHWIVDPDSPGLVDAIGGVGWALVPLGDRRRDLRARASGSSTARRRGSRAPVAALTRARRERLAALRQRHPDPLELVLPAARRAPARAQRSTSRSRSARSSTRRPDLCGHEAGNRAAPAGRSPRAAAASRCTGSRSRRWPCPTP